MSQLGVRLEAAIVIDMIMIVMDDVVVEDAMISKYKLFFISSSSLERERENNIS